MTNEKSQLDLAILKLEEAITARLTLRVEKTKAALAIKEAQSVYNRLLDQESAATDAVFEARAQIKKSVASLLSEQLSSTSSTLTDNELKTVS